ncbi:YIP1 family protein [candidate division WOR-3 bacterium]|nr:YIP1 family protein [candidate division WOR-3 bacterium]
MGNLINIIVEPVKVFKHIKEKDDWWIPFILLVVVTWIFLMISGPALARITAQQMAEMGVDREIPKFVEYIKYLGAPIGTLTMWLLMSVIIWFLGNSFGGDWDFTKALDLYAYSSVVQVLRTILTTVILLIRGIPNIMTFKDINVATGLNLLFSPENPRLYALFSGIEVFSIWQFVLIAYGVSEITGMPKKKAVWVSVITYLITLGFGVIFARKGMM